MNISLIFVVFLLLVMCSIKKTAIQLQYSQ